MNTTENVYLAIKGDVVVHHTSLSAMFELDGIAKPDKTVTSKEFEEAGGLARLIDGKIFLGKTDDEKKKDADNERIAEIDKELTEIDLSAARSSRAVAYAFAMGETPESADVAKIKEYEEKSAELRKERAELVKEVESL